MSDEPDRADELRGLVVKKRLASCASCGCCAKPGRVRHWVGAGAIRDLVWDELHDGFDPDKVLDRDLDLDVVFFDADQVGRGREEAAEGRLAARLTGVRWDVTNQAGVHRWYERRYGLRVEPLTSLEDGVATWPETATAVAVRLDVDDRLTVTAPFGLDDLLDGICRHNPRRVP